MKRAFLLRQCKDGKFGFGTAESILIKTGRNNPSISYRMMSQSTCPSCCPLNSIISLRTSPDLDSPEGLDLLSLRQLADTPQPPHTRYRSIQEGDFEIIEAPR
jgi:hypothetical protein